MKSIFEDTLYLLVFTALAVSNSWALASGSSPSWFVPISVLFQGFMFVGLMEAFHQTVHMNLYPWRPLNIFLGRLMGAHLGLGFTAYRRFHMTHHSTTNTPSDPEKAFYQSPASTLGLLFYPFVYLFRNAGVVNKGAYLRLKDRSAHRFEMATVLLFRIGTVAVTFYYPMQMLMAYWLPYYVFFYIELYMSQSQHYFSYEQQKAPRGIEHYKAGVNVSLPWPFGFLCMYTNLHATHHVKASIKWYKTPSITRRDASHVVSIGFLSFLHIVLTRGARLWREREVT